MPNYSLEVNPKTTTRDKNHFIIDLGRGLHPSLLPPVLSSEIGVLHASISFPMVYLKDFK